MTEQRPTQQFSAPSGPSSSPDWQHDTTVLGGYGQGQGGYSQEPQFVSGQQWGQQPAVGNPEAEYWQGRYRRQRTWTIVLGGLLAAGLVFLAVPAALLAGGLIARDATTAGSSEPAPATPDGSDQLPSTPDGQTSPDGEGTPDGGGDDLTTAPLPEELRGLGSMLGINNLDELLDKAVSMGLMTEEQADKLREAARSGQSLLPGWGDGSDQGGPSGSQPGGGSESEGSGTA